MADGAPFYVTALVAALAWTFTHGSDRITQTPFLLYSVQNITLDGKTSTHIDLHNITRDKTFKNVNIVVTAATTDTVLSGSIIPYQPAYEGDKPWRIAGRTFEFTFPAIEPAWQFEINVLHKTDAPVAIRLSTTGDQYFYATQPSTETYLVEHELGITLAFFIISAIALAVAILSSRKTASSSPQEPPVSVSVTESIGRTGERTNTTESTLIVRKRT
jgi:hypothetical protein